MGRLASSYVALGRSVPHKLTRLAFLCGAWFLRDAFAARPSSEQKGHYVAILQTGTFSHTEGRTEETEARNNEALNMTGDLESSHSGRHEDHEDHSGDGERREETPAPDNPVVTEIEEKGGLAELEKIIASFQAGKFGEGGEDKEEHPLGPFPKTRPSELPNELKALYEADTDSGGSAISDRVKAMPKSSHDELKQILNKLDSSTLGKIKAELENLKKGEEAEEKRKRKGEEIKLAREDLKQLQDQLGQKRGDLIKEVETYVEQRLKPDGGDKDASAEKYQLMEFLQGVQSVETLLQEFDDKRKEAKVGTLYHWGDALPTEYATKAGLPHETLTKLHYHPGTSANGGYGPPESANKVFGPSDDANAPYVRAGEPNHPKTTGPRNIG